MQPRDATGEERGGLVLVVEDDRSTRELLAAILAEEGLEFHLTSNGHVAMEYAREHPPDLVVLDMHLPNLQGEAVATALRVELGQGLPILAMSASNERAAASRFDAYAYVSKPFEVDDFVARVREGLELSGQAHLLRERTIAARRRLEQSLAIQRRSFDQALAADDFPPKTATGA